MRIDMIHLTLNGDEDFSMNPHGETNMPVLHVDVYAPNPDDSKTISITFNSIEQLDSLIGMLQEYRTIGGFVFAHHEQAEAK